VPVISSIYEGANSRAPRARFFKTPTRRLMKRVSAEQKEVLRWFWHEYKATESLRQPQRKWKILSLLKLAAAKRFDPRCDARLVRRNFNQLKYRLPELNPKGKKCFACGAWARVPHHVIFIEHGGTNSPLNLVFLCRSCHGAIHPWLRDGSVTPVLRDGGGEAAPPRVSTADTPLAE
jgi:5-methylcytosine-specific restriction endonuclease McrA